MANANSVQNPSLGVSLPPIRLAEEGGAPRIGSGPRESDSPEHDVRRCRSCGKEAELEDGLCPECKWEIEVGLKPSPAPEKKRSLWSIFKHESH